MLFDLHCHSQASDGRLRPAELAHRAVARGVDVLALTDHDTVAGLAELRQEIADHQLPLTLIDGVEISTGWQNFDIHIVGLRLDPENPGLTAFLAGQDDVREQRARRIGEKLAKARIPGVYEGAKAIAGAAQVTRAHIARFLVECGAAKDNAAAFKKYLARGKSGYVPNPWPEMGRAIEVIHGAGGQAVLAHPHGYDLSAKWLRRLIIEFKSLGGDAIEVAACQQSPAHRQQLARYCQEYDLKASQGSDFHFPASWIELGRNLYLPKDCQGIWQQWPEFHTPG